MVTARLSEAAKKRLRAGRMLMAGKSCASVALAVSVARQTMHTWKRLFDEGGIDALRVVPQRGRPAQLDGAQLAALRKAILRRPSEHGFGTELWTLKRVGAVIGRMHGVRFCQTQVWRILGSLGFSPQKPDKQAIERDEDAVRAWSRRTWPTLKKKAQREGRLICVIDESGLSERPTRVRTWGLKGQTPIIQFHFNWHHISVIAGLTRTHCMFRLHEGSIKKEQVVEFLKALKAHLKQPLLIIWDGLKAHRSRLVRDYLDSLNEYIQIAFLLPSLRARPQSGGVPVGLAQASRHGQLLFRHPRRAAQHRAQQTQERPEATFHHRRLLDAGYALVVS